MAILKMLNFHIVVILAILSIFTTGCKEDELTAAVSDAIEDNIDRPTIEEDVPDQDSSLDPDHEPVAETSPSEEPTVIPSLIPSEGPNGEITSITPIEDGGAIVAGSFTEFDGTPAPGIIKIDSQGNIDKEFTETIGTGTKGEITAISESPDGGLLLLGDFRDFNGNPADNSITLNDDGTINKDITPPSFDSPVKGAHVTDNGEILVYGDFKEVGGGEENQDKIALLDSEAKPSDWSDRGSTDESTSTETVSNSVDPEYSDNTLANNETAENQVDEVQATNPIPEEVVQESTESQDPSVAPMDQEVTEVVDQNSTISPSDMTEGSQPSSRDVADIGQDQNSDADYSSDQCSGIIDEALELRRNILNFRVSIKNLKKKIRKESKEYKSRKKLVAKDKRKDIKKKWRLRRAELGKEIKSLKRMRRANNHKFKAFKKDLKGTPCFKQLKAKLRSLRKAKKS